MNIRVDINVFVHSWNQLVAKGFVPNIKKKNNMNPIIQEILEKGIKIQVEFNPKTGLNEYIIGGFYKSDTIKLIEEPDITDNLMAIARYDEKTLIYNFDDLVHLNNAWWLSGKDRFEGWLEPDPRWLPFLLEKGLVKKETKVIYKSTIK